MQIAHGESLTVLRASIRIATRSPSRPLCYEDGDVIVETYNQSSKYLVLHKNILEGATPPLGAVIARWSQPTLIEHPTSGRQVEVYRLKLDLVDGILSLKAKVCLFDRKAVPY